MTSPSGKGSIEVFRKQIEEIAIAATYVQDAFNGVRMVVNGVVAYLQKMISYTLLFWEKFTALGNTIQSRLSFIPGMKGMAAFNRNASSIAKELKEDFASAASANWGQAKDQFGNLGKSREELKKFFEKVADDTASTAAAKATSVVDAIAEEQDKQTKKYSGDAEIFSSQNLKLEGLRDKYKPRTDEILDEMLILQRKAFA